MTGPRSLQNGGWHEAGNIVSGGADNSSDCACPIAACSGKSSVHEHGVAFDACEPQRSKEHDQADRGIDRKETKRWTARPGLTWRNDPTPDQISANVFFGCANGVGMRRSKVTVADTGGTHNRPLGRAISDAQNQHIHVRSSNGPYRQWSRTEPSTLSHISGNCHSGMPRSLSTRCSSSAIPRPGPSTLPFRMIVPCVITNSFCR